MIRHMHTALTIPEILNRIFELLPCSANAINAQVCKAWLNPALDEVWHEIFDVSKTFRSLADTVISSGKVYYVRPPTLTEWNDFLVNCDRVRVLNFDIHNSKTPLSADALLQIATTRPRGSIFTNTHTLQGSCLNDTFYPMLMSDSVTDLRLSIKAANAEDQRKRLLWDIDTIIARMPRIIKLGLETSTLDPEPLEPFILQFLKGFPSLVELQVPYKCLRPSVAESASQLPKLRVLCGYPGTDTIYDTANLPIFTPKLVEDSFPLLEYFSFTAIIGDAIQLVRNPHFPSQNLREVHFRAIIDTRGSADNDISRFLEAVADAWASIDVLCIHMQTSFSNGQRRLSIDFDNIAPVFRLSNLTTFCLYNDDTIHMTDDEASQLASSMPNLRKLHLTPHASQPPSLTLQCLVHFAKRCTELNTLSLVLDAREDMIPPATNAIPFCKLRFLHLGDSPISLVQTAVQFLARTLPVKCFLLAMGDKVVGGIPVYRTPSPNKSMDRLWRDVQDTLLRISESKHGWIEKEWSMQSEITRLKRENDMLKAKLGAMVKAEKEILETGGSLLPNGGTK